MATKNTTKSLETLTHDEAKRKNIPSVEQQSIASQEQIAPGKFATHSPGQTRGLTASPEKIATATLIGFP